MSDLYELPITGAALRFTTAELDAAGIDPARFDLSA